jgi:hypothetical protein
MLGLLLPPLLHLGLQRTQLLIPAKQYEYSDGCLFKCSFKALLTVSELLLIPRTDRDMI